LPRISVVAPPLCLSVIDEWLESLALRGYGQRGQNLSICHIHVLMVFLFYTGLLVPRNFEDSFRF